MFVRVVASRAATMIVELCRVCLRRPVTGAVALDTDTRGVDVQWSENATADSFGKNLVFARCESRYATSVFSPLGVVSLNLTA